ncbi:hypothetical protein VNO78_23825 [Psophocarpus tetragonolobus]|uniref:Uncharacterized protein n=1 Tax=Psophocarpus tetragonolobus TaxID=3891 RepID=A0AAN9XER6_PSOTE
MLLVTWAVKGMSFTDLLERAEWQTLCNSKLRSFHPLGPQHYAADVNGSFDREHMDSEVIEVHGQIIATVTAPLLATQSVPLEPIQHPPDQQGLRCFWMADDHSLTCPDSSQSQNRPHPSITFASHPYQNSLIPTLVTS